MKYMCRNCGRSVDVPGPGTSEKIVNLTVDHPHFPEPGCNNCPLQFPADDPRFIARAVPVPQ